MRTYISAYLSKHAHSFEKKSWLWFCAKRKPCLLALPSFFPYEPGNTTYSIKVLPFLDDKKSNKSFSYSRHGQNYEHFLLPFPAFSNQSCLLIQLFFPQLLPKGWTRPSKVHWRTWEAAKEEKRSKPKKEFPIVKLIMWDRQKHSKLGAIISYMPWVSFWNRNKKNWFC